MSKAYYYVKNFSFKEINNLFAYQVKDPSVLTKHQRITRLYKGTLRKLQATYFNTVRGKDYEKFIEETTKAREDFDALLNSDDPLYYDAMVEKYELLIESLFEPDASLNPSRPYSNLNGKLVLYGNDVLQSDPIGYYSKNKLVTGKPTGVGFYEEYPDQANAWVYEELELNDDFDYTDDELGYKTEGSRDAIKKHLDDLNK